MFSEEDGDERSENGIIFCPRIARDVTSLSVVVSRRVFAVFALNSLNDNAT